MASELCAIWCVSLSVLHRDFSDFGGMQHCLTRCTQNRCPVCRGHFCPRRMRAVQRVLAAAPIELPTAVSKERTRQCPAAAVHSKCKRCRAAVIPGNYGLCGGCRTGPVTAEEEPIVLSPRVTTTTAETSTTTTVLDGLTSLDLTSIGATFRRKCIRQDVRANFDTGWLCGEVGPTLNGEPIINLLNVHIAP